MIALDPATTWWSRLAWEGLAFDLGITLDPSREIPHVRGVPIPVPIPEAHTVVREWPNRSGRCEAFSEHDLVRWDRSLAPPPSAPWVIPRGTEVDPTEFVERQRWFAKFVRSLEQIPKVVRAVPSDTLAAIVLTPARAMGDLPAGVDPVPRQLGEFPGGITIRVPSKHWEDRDAYADIVRAWLRVHATT
ncbi:MAG: hypothetical protein R2823_07985 [Acidimicrobiia bacterium]